MPILEVKDIHKHFGANEVLKGVSFSLEKGEVLGIIGSSGGGKTTVSRLAARFWDIDKGLIPTGKLLPVEGTAFDFNKPKAIGKDIKETGVGYDHCYVTEMYNPENPQCAMPLTCDDLVEFATVTEPVSGHEMSVYTNMEGCQFFTANFFNGIKLKNGVPYPNHGAFCLETQAFPDTPNKKEFPSCNLKPGQKMKAKTVYSFKI